MNDGTPDSDDKRAFQRWVALNLVRIIGAILILAGIAVLEQLLPLPPVFSYVLVLIGFLVFFFGPRALAKGWRSDER